MTTAELRNVPTQHPWTMANAITIGRGVFVVIVAIALQRHNLPLAALAAVIFGLGDLVDGRVARATGTVSRLGQLLDSATDKAFALGVLYGAWAGDYLPRWLLQLVVVCAAVQVRLAAEYWRAGIGWQRPKTLAGPCLGVVLLAHLLSDAAGGAHVEVAVAVLAINGVALYALPWLAPAGQIRSPQLRAGSVSRIVANYRSKLVRDIEPVARALTIANAITVVRLLPAAVSVAGIARGDLTWFVAGLVCFISLDMVDGYVARSRGEVTVIGRYLDVVIDKAFLLAVLTAGVAVGAVPTWLAVLSIGRVVSIAVAAVVATRRGAPLPRNVWSAAANVAALAAVVSSSITWELLAVGLATQNVIAYVLPVIRRLTLSDQRTEHQGAFNEDA